MNDGKLEGGMGGPSVVGVTMWRKLGLFTCVGVLHVYSRPEGDTPTREVGDKWQDRRLRL